MARRSYETTLGPSHTPVMGNQNQKRPKDTSSGPAISPETLKLQPPQKMWPGKGLNFSGKTMYVIMKLKLH